MFDTALATLQEHAAIIGSRNIQSPHLIIVLGEYHFVPLIQRDMLYTLLRLHTATQFSLFGAEGRRTQFAIARARHIIYKKALLEESYMETLLGRKIDASTIFAKLHRRDVTAKVVDDPTLRSFAFQLVKRSRQLWNQKHAAGDEGLTKEGQKEFEYWTELHKQIALRDRSDVMVRNLFRWQLRFEEPLSVLICGLDHTPYLKAHAPLSVLPTLEQLPVNFIIAAPRSALYLRHKDKSQIDPFEFWNPITDEDWEGIPWQHITAEALTPR